MKRPKGW